MVKNGTVRLAPTTNRRLTWRTSAVFSASGPTIIPGVSQRRRSGRAEASQGRMEGAGLLLRQPPRLGLVGDRQVDDAVRDLDGHRADLVGMEDAEPAALDHRGPAHADRRVRRRDDDVAAAEEGGVAGEAAAGVD